MSYSSGIQLSPHGIKNQNTDLSTNVKTQNLMDLLDGWSETEKYAAGTRITVSGRFEEGCSMGLHSTELVWFHTAIKLTDGQY